MCIARIHMDVSEDSQGGSSSRTWNAAVMKSEQQVTSASLNLCHLPSSVIELIYRDNCLNMFVVLHC